MGNVVGLSVLLFLMISQNTAMADGSHSSPAKADTAQMDAAFEVAQADNLRRFSASRRFDYYESHYKKGDQRGKPHRPQQNYFQMINGVMCSDGEREFAGIVHSQIGRPYLFYLERDDKVSPTFYFERQVKFANLNYESAKLAYAYPNVVSELSELERLQSTGNLGPNGQKRLTEVKALTEEIKEEQERLKREMLKVHDIEADRFFALFRRPTATSIQLKGREVEIPEQMTVPNPNVPFAKQVESQGDEARFIHEEKDGQGKPLRETTYSFIEYGPVGSGDTVFRIEEKDLQAAPGTKPKVTYCF